MTNNIIIFDGVCNLCNASVQFIIKRDRQGTFKFTSAQSESGKNLLREHGYEHIDPKSVILLKDRHAYEKSSAALLIAAELDGGWKYLAVLKLIPRPIRDLVYDWIAKNRYRWFGKRNTCMLPSPDIESRFL